LQNNELAEFFVHLKLFYYMGSSLNKLKIINPKSKKCMQKL